MGVKNCFTFVISHIMSFFNVICMLAGAALIGTTLYFHYRIALGYFSNIEIGALALGSLVVLISMVGFCGITSRSSGLMKLYFGLLLIVFLAQIALGAVAYFNVSKTERIPESVEKMWPDLSLQTRRGVQKALSCCGLNDIQEDSICSSIPNIRPCKVKIADVLENGLTVLAIVAFSLGGLQFLLLLFSCFLSGVFSEKNRLARRSGESSRSKTSKVSSRPPLPKV